MANVNVDSVRLHSETWAEQYRAALTVNGGDLENATTVDYVLHFLTFGWKVKLYFNIIISLYSMEIFVVIHRLDLTILLADIMLH